LEQNRCQTQADQNSPDGHAAFEKNDIVFKVLFMDRIGNTVSRQFRCKHAKNLQFFLYFGPEAPVPVSRPSRTKHECPITVSKAARIGRIRPAGSADLSITTGIFKIYVKRSKFSKEGDPHDHPATANRTDG
jgi:hypothetical protein